MSEEYSPPYSPNLVPGKKTPSKRINRLLFIFSTDRTISSQFGMAQQLTRIHSSVVVAMLSRSFLGQALFGAFPCNQIKSERIFCQEMPLNKNILSDVVVFLHYLSPFQSCSTDAILYDAQISTSLLSQPNFSLTLHHCQLQLAALLTDELVLSKRTLNCKAELAQVGWLGALCNGSLNRYYLYH